MVGAFAKDYRVLAWDLWNEPDNETTQYPATPNKMALVEALLPQVFAWARAAQPTQPLTSGVWRGNWSDPERESRTTKIQLAESDILTFHNYDWPEGFEARIKELQPLGRPILCTEYMAAGRGQHLRRFAAHCEAVRRGGDQLGAGRRQDADLLPLGFLAAALRALQPAVWFHEVFRQDGRPYRQHEVNEIRTLTGRATPSGG